MNELLNKLLDQRVVHTSKTLGNGTIKKYETRDGTIYIFVSFDSTPSKLIQFHFPDIFVDSYHRMSSDSLEVNEVIKRIADSKACEICKSTNNKTLSKYGRKICQSCLSQFRQCAYCYSPLHPKEAAISEFNDENRLYYICKDCIGKFKKCLKCGDEYYFPKREKYWPEIPEEYEICGSCFEESYSMCAECEKLVLNNDIIQIRDYLFCKECVKNKLPMCSRCGAKIPKQYTYCDACENVIAYEEFVEKIVETIEHYPERVIRKDYDSFCRDPHTDTVNRLCGCKKPYADCLLVSIGEFSLVIIYLENRSKADYMIRCKSYDCYTMTQVRTSLNSSQWSIYEDEQNYREFTGKDGGAFFAWEKPVRINAITDHVNDYGYHRNWFGDTEGFYVIGTWRYIKREQTIFCNNKSCPYKDCRRHVNSIQDQTKRRHVTQIDMQCTCARYTRYLANQLNKLLK